MRPRLIVHLTGDPDTPLSWRCLDAQGSPMAAPEGETLAAAARERRVLALAPGTEVLTTRVHIPVRGRQRVAQAVPWALEDQLSEDVDALHFAIGERDAEGMVHVAVVSEQALAAWREQLDDAGVQAEDIYPDYLALPRHEHAWTILVDDHRAWVRTGLQTGFACDADALALFLEAALTEAGDDAPPRLVVYLSETATLQLPEVAPEPERYRVSDPLAVFAEHLDSRHAIGLRPASWGGASQAHRWWRTWRAAVVLVAAVIIADTGHAWLQRWQLAATAEEQQAAIARIFGDTFPEAGTPVYPRRQMESRLAALRSGDDTPSGGMLPLLARLTPGLADERIELTALAYRGGGLEIQVSAPDLQVLDALKQRLTGEGLTVEVRSARNERDHVIGRLTVEGEA